MKLTDLTTQVREKNLSKEQLEAYRDQMCELYALMTVEMADIEKKEAIFFSECQ